MTHAEGITTVLLDSEAYRVEHDNSVVLLGCRCQECGTISFPRTQYCANCLSDSLVTEELPRQGILYSFTTVHAGPKKWAKPMTLGYVDLTKDLRVFGHIDNSNNNAVMDGNVEVALRCVGAEEDGRKIFTYAFRPLTA